LRDLTIALWKQYSTVLLPIDQFEELLLPTAGERADKFLRFIKQVYQERSDPTVTNRHTAI